MTTSIAALCPSRNGEPPSPDGVPRPATGRVLPVDRLLAGYNALLAGVWGALLGKTPEGPWMCAAHLAALTLPLWLERAPARPARPVRALRELYPILWVIAFWGELGVVLPVLHVTTCDAHVAALDLALFGRHLNAVWMARMPAVWFSELMHLLYFAYYLLIAVPPLVLAWSGRTMALRDMTLRLVVTYLGCYVVYLVCPSAGPAHTLPHYAGPLSHGLFYRLTHRAALVGDSIGTAFPSSHVAVAVTIALAGRRWFPRRVAALLALEAAGVFVSTVYTQNHYPIDALSGLLYAVVLQLAVVPLLARRLDRGRGGAARSVTRLTPALE